MATVTFEKVVKKYTDQAVILKQIDLTVADGEFLVLVGPSGCGKSTLLRTLAGLEQIDDGTIRIGEKRVNDLPPKERDIAMVFQSYALYPHMTARENMGFGLKVRRMPAPEIKKRVDEAAAMLDIAHLLDRYPRQMSGGQRQRIAIGRAVVRSPQVFLFDEPLSNLDAALRTQMRVELKQLHARLGTTIIYVTHDQIEAMTLADRIVVLDKGTIQQIGTPYELYHEPTNTFVARFIGTPAMNLIELPVTGRELRGKGIRLPLPAALRHERLTVGIRPTDLAPGGEPSAPGITGTVELIEPLGAAVILHLRTADERKIIAEIAAGAARDLVAGTTLHLTVPPDKIHLFDTDSGSRITDRA